MVMTLPCAKLLYTKTGRNGFFLQMLKSQKKKKKKRYTKICENVGQSKEQNKTLETNTKEMQIYELPDQKKI